MRREGFSLIEMTIVLLILGIAAGAVALRMHGPMRRAQLADVVDQVTHFDRLARTHAREHDRPLRLVVDLATGRLWRTDERGVQDGFPPLALPERYRIARLVVRNQDVTYGSVSLTCSRRGLTPSYALLLTGPGGQSKWIVVAGLTGQHVEVDSEDAVKKILAATRRRADAR